MIGPPVAQNNGVAGKLLRINKDKVHGGDEEYAFNL
jgi:hypothetical protein